MKNCPDEFTREGGIQIWFKGPTWSTLLIHHHGCCTFLRGANACFPSFTDTQEAEDRLFQATRATCAIQEVYRLRSSPAILEGEDC